MPQDFQAPPKKPPLQSLATRVILVVFLATFLTASVVSWLAVRSTYTFLREDLGRRLPRQAQTLAARVGPALSADLGTAVARAADPTPEASPPSVQDRLRSALASSRSEQELGLEDLRVLVADARGRVLWAVRGPGKPGDLRPEVTRDAVAIYRNEGGLFLVGTAADLPTSGLRLVIEQPFRYAFAPVFSVLTRIFLADLCIVMLFSLLAYRLTAAIVRPIEDLSQGARRVSTGELEVEVPEPPGHDEIALLTRTFNDMTRKLRRQRAEIETASTVLRERNHELQRANEVLEQLSITDGLTKLHNHRFFQDFLTREIKRVTRSQEPLSMLLIDIDDFKRLNDRLGHASGDELLIGLARLLNEATRDSDLAARYGGEEFVVLAPETELQGAVQLAQKIRMSVESSSFILDDSMQLTKMTVSIGVAQYRGNRKTFFLAADQALYRAKAAGKNCVLEAEEEAPAANA